jgi:hypothetical protein
MTCFIRTDSSTDLDVIKWLIKVGLEANEKPTERDLKGPGKNTNKGVT